nr:BCCT family transporter [Vallicoccus soli]
MLLVSAGVVTLFVLWGVLSPESLSELSGDALARVTGALDWAFVLASGGFLVLAVWLAASRYGHVRLGGPDARPEFRTASWIAMMFSAGMGIGLMFWGVSEPVSHLLAPPPGGGEPGTRETALDAMEWSYFHWAAHPWAMYAVVGLALAYFGYRRGGKPLISETFRPLIGDRVDGTAGRAIEVLAIVATLFGSATSLGLGALQITSGLDYVWGVDPSDALAVAVIGVLTLAFLASALSGVHRGIQWLSSTNMVLALLLVVFVLAVGPTVAILDTFTSSVGGYLTALPGMATTTGANADPAWLGSWTIFYWAWWISWTPFVGAFIARISRGRTVREFVLGVILAPSLVSFVWFSVLGGTALDLSLDGVTAIGDAVGESPEAGLFATLQQLPWFTATSVLVVVLVALFFVSGADAAAVVLAMMSSRGSVEPARPVVALWGVLTGLVAGVLLLAGGLGAVQTMCIVAAFPFMLVMVGTCVSLVLELRRRHRPEPPDGPGRPAARTLDLTAAEDGARRRGADPVAP